MALEHATRPLYGVQFHPESISTAHGDALLRNFARIAEARAWRGCASSAGGGDPAAISVVPRSLSACSAQRGVLTPVVRRLRAWADPEAVFEQCFARAESAFWLDSAKPDGAASRFSYMGSVDESHGWVLCGLFLMARVDRLSAVDTT